jgi:hypothetical protein
VPSAVGYDWRMEGPVTMRAEHTAGTRAPSALTRRTALGGVGAAAAAVGLGGVSRVAAQGAGSEMATHPIIGVWLSMNPGDPPQASPVSFTADGIMTVAFAPSYIDPGLGVTFQGTAIGVWEPTGERSIQFIFVQALSDVDGTYLGTFTLEGYPEVSEDGLSFVDEGTRARVTIRDANNVITMQAGGGEGAEPITPPVHARRMRIANAGFPEATPVAGTPTG